MEIEDNAERAPDGCSDFGTVCVWDVADASRVVFEFSVRYNGDFKMYRFLCFAHESWIIYVEKNHIQNLLLKINNLLLSG